MKESTFFKWLVVSTLLHFICIAALSIPISKSTRRIDLSNSYSVSLVGDLGAGREGPGNGAKPAARETPAKEQPKPVPVKEKKPAPVKEKPVKAKPEKPVPAKPEKETVSLAKKKLPVKQTQIAPKKETPSKDELAALNRRLREIKKRTDYLDITKGGPEGAGARGAGSSGLPFSGEGAGRPLDLVTQKYWRDVGDRIMAAWGLPGAAYRNLETEVTIKVRKDGRIVDINVDKRSGNRIFDESILRALRSVDPLPPIPASLNLDSIELPFRFRPEETS